jgi:GGDEF domain-containing protein
VAFRRRSDPSSPAEAPTPNESAERVRRLRAALFDATTGLPGVVLLLDRMEIALARSDRYGPLVAVVVFDDVRGRADSEDAMLAFALHLRQGVRPDDTVARIAGRTFVLVLNDIEDREVVSRIVRRLLDPTGFETRVGFAFGSPPVTADELLGRALREVVPPG